MRIRIIRRPDDACIDGIQLDRFEPGHEYDVNAALGCLLLAEQWAELTASGEPAVVIPLAEAQPRFGSLKHPANLIIETAPPYIDPVLTPLFARRARRRS